MGFIFYRYRTVLMKLIITVRKLFSVGILISEIFFRTVPYDTIPGIGTVLILAESFQILESNDTSSA